MAQEPTQTEEVEEDRVSQENELGPGSQEEEIEQEVYEEVEAEEEVLEGELEAEAEAEEEGESAAVGATTAGEINTSSLDELHLNDVVVRDAQDAWKQFINSAVSREAAGEAIYAALFDAAPSLQSLFTTPRAIQAMKFMNGLNQFIMGLSDPPALKVAVETLGFGHLALDVTIPRVHIFRDAILDLFQVELGSRLTAEAYTGWRAMLNYVGGAIIFIKAFYADRIRLLGESWAAANDKGANKDKFATLGSMEVAETDDKKDDKKKGDKDKENSGEHNGNGTKGGSESIVQNVPTTFKEMFQFNAAVMGFGQSMWMNEVLACYDNIVSNVSNSGRLVEECDVLVCRIAKVASGKVNLAEFKSCMLASLRSLLPKDWTTAHEVAWSWLWENVEKMIMKNMGMPPKWEQAYAKLLDSIDEATGFQLRKDIYLKFFAIAPAGQDFFKQSNTYLHLIATKVLVMVIDIYRDPVRMVDDISALGLRHVGYAIPTEYMPPFASACVEVVQTLTKDQDCIDGFQWSIGLIAKSLVRTILEGSTIVMKAINTNTIKSLTKAIAVAPRGERTAWILLIQVGTQNISPLAWAVESGALNSASAMIIDLLTFRADRDKYYYGAEDLFKRHHNVMEMLLNNAPGLVPDLLDGLVWRARVTVNAMRRVNYYIKYLLVSPEGKFAKNLEWVAKTKDPKIVCHPVLVLLSDLVWSRVASRSFLLRKTWFLFTLLLFVASQSVLSHTQPYGEEKTEPERILTAVFRGLIYTFSMGSMISTHTAKTFRAYTKGDTVYLGKCPLPGYLTNWQESANLCLMVFLMVMLASEPILHCISYEPLFAESCPGAQRLKTFPYSVFSMFSMVFYYVLLIDLAVFNNRVSAFVLVCGRMIGEVCLFLVGLFMLVLTFSCAFSCLLQDAKQFKGIHTGAQALFEMVVQMFSTDDYQSLEEEPVIICGVFIFQIFSVIFLINMLVAQLTCAYDAVYVDMVGYARLKRIRIIVESMPQVSDKTWERFIGSLRLDQRIEFNEGDVGVSGGIQVMEPASANPTTVDAIQRFGGSTSPSISWPEEDGVDDSDKFERLETLVKRTMERLNKGGGGGKKGKNGSSTGQGSGSGTHGEAEGSGGEGSQAGSQVGSEGAEEEE